MSTIYFLKIFFLHLGNRSQQTCHIGRSGVKKTENVTVKVTKSVRTFSEAKVTAGIAGSHGGKAAAKPEAERIGVIKGIREGVKTADL